MDENDFFFLSLSFFFSYFLVFASAMRWLKYSFPLALMLGALNPNYILSTEEKTNFMAPFKRREDFGGVVAFPVDMRSVEDTRLVPVDDRRLALLETP